MMALMQKNIQRTYSTRGQNEGVYGKILGAEHDHNNNYGQYENGRFKMETFW
jgi:hypothetical protein